jgi:hypothetical protein
MNLTLRSRTSYKYKQYGLKEIVMLERHAVWLIGLLVSVLGCAHQSNLPPGYTIGPKPIPVRLTIDKLSCGGSFKGQICPKIDENQLIRAFESGVTSSLPPELQGKFVFDEHGNMPPGQHGEVLHINGRISLGFAALRGGINAWLEVKLVNSKGDVLWKNSIPDRTWSYRNFGQPKKLLTNNAQPVYQGAKKAMEFFLERKLWKALSNDMTDTGK